MSGLFFCSDQIVSLSQNGFYVGPVRGVVQVESHPTAGADIRRSKITFRSGFDQCCLRTFSGSTPDCDPVVMVMIGKHGKAPLAFEEPCRLTMTQALLYERKARAYTTDVA